MFFGKKSAAVARETEPSKAESAATPRTNLVPPALPETAAPPIPGAQPPLEVLAQLSPEETQRRAAVSRQLAATFGNVITLLMRLPEYKSLRLADLQWLVVPPLLTGQFSIATAQSKVNGATTPVGVVLWARVSPEVDRRLTAMAGHQLKLAPQEWTSGNIHWIIAAVGEQKILPGILNRLLEKELARNPVKIVSPGKDGKPAVYVLGMKTA